MLFTNGPTTSANLCIHLKTTYRSSHRRIVWYGLQSFATILLCNKDLLWRNDFRTFLTIFKAYVCYKAMTAIGAKVFLYQSSLVMASTIIYNILRIAYRGDEIYPMNNSTKELTYSADRIYPALMDDKTIRPVSSNIRLVRRDDTYKSIDSLANEIFDASADWVENRNNRP